MPELTIGVPHSRAFVGNEMYRYCLKMKTGLHDWLTFIIKSGL